MDLSFIIPVAHAAESVESGGALGTLGLNAAWFIGQLINFAIVVFVFWKWIIPALQKRLDARTKHIAQSLAQAENIEKQHADLAVWKKQLMEQVEAEAAADLKERKAQAERLTEAMLATARAEQEKVVAATRKQMEQEREQAVQAFRTEMAGLVVSATQKIVQEKLDKDKDKSLIKKILSEVTGV